MLSVEAPATLQNRLSRTKTVVKLGAYLDKAEAYVLFSTKRRFGDAPRPDPRVERNGRWRSAARGSRHEARHGDGQSVVETAC